MAMFYGWENVSGSAFIKGKNLKKIWDIFPSIEHRHGHFWEFFAFSHLSNVHAYWTAPGNNYINLSVLSENFIF